MADDETLLGVSAVHLFGRPLSDLILQGGPIYQNLSVPSAGRNFLKEQLGAADAALARIFAFSFEGAFVELSRPAIFVVHGPGVDPNDPPPANVDYERLYRSPGSNARTGLGSQIGALAKDMRVWIYDKGEVSMRLDAETGTLEQILLSAELSTDPRGASGGLSRSGALSRSGVMSRSGGFITRRTDSD